MKSQNDIQQRNTNVCFIINYFTQVSDTIVIREYGSTLYVGMARKKNGRPYISNANGKLKSLVIYTNK